MTGGSFLGLVLLSMAWLFGLGGIAANYQVLRMAMKAKEGKRVPSGLGFVPGVAASLAVFFTLPLLKGWGIEVPWPWLWVLLPLFADPYCLGAFLVMAYLRLRRPSG